ncbi:hypothetical protein Murru_2310 [Allomuricauda ruestringensis DSM 13258]|uniref:Cytochrome c domain-containing protein n=1 Tax=Allomuricauda ruestringensis (strain DSM 13258 / CIP 107369 / LMG 19739 / B1) TaxID=886377 RepID=G2PNG8_ALLRU|nr:hypothetical protein [Allomuricauda ruestringensis]AEM71348.1 hypothetical protein Murru_2310 [Allomuricauda ruestringensis DSM 13258]
MKKDSFSTQFCLTRVLQVNKKFQIGICVLFVAFIGCTDDRLPETTGFDVDSDGDGIWDEEEIQNGTDKNNPCDPIQDFDYTVYDELNLIWSNSDCDNDGISNAEELVSETNPYMDETLDSDGDGIPDFEELKNGTDRYSACDPFQNAEYSGYLAENAIWSSSDCDHDGISNGKELANSTNPYLDEIGGIDTDGDGIKDEREVLDGTNLNDPCDPIHSDGYTGYDSDNEIWVNSDCDDDGINNGDELSQATDPYLDNRVYAVPEFLSTLSGLQIFQGPLSNLEPVETSYEYNLSTTVFTDYSYQLRTISVPKSKQMVYNGSGLLQFPDNTVLSMTFFYPNDERNPSLGKKIIETRVLIKTNGIWSAGNYIWNNAQTEAYLDEGTHTVPVAWVDKQGNNRTVNYKVPPTNLCIQCHGNNSVLRPIGIKTRALNFEHNGINQIAYFVGEGLLYGAPDISQIEVLPDWTDTSIFLEDRARAYLDVNCAHCHQPGGSYTVNYGGEFDFSYETSFQNSKINDVKTAIITRMNTQIPGYFMPLLGTTVIHTEGVELIEAYIDTLD